MSINRPLRRFALCTLLTAAALAGCGGGSGDGASEATPSVASATGTLRLSLTDAPACGYDEAFVTVERVRVHRSATAGDGDTGWAEVVLPAPQRIDLLTLSNGALLPLGQTELPAGTYTQLRLVLAPNTASNPLANAVTPSGGTPTALTTPSGQQSGLKLNINLEVPADQVADVALDFDACKSFVRAGNSGKILLKPVLAAIPILSSAGQRIVGFVDGALRVAGATVSAQVDGTPVRATPPDASGRFTLYPVPAGTVDVVVTAPGHVNAVLTGVPVSSSQTTLIGSDAVRLSTPLAATSPLVTGVLRIGGKVEDTNGAVRALQRYSGGPTIEAGYAAADAASGSYRLLLPVGAPVRTPFVAGATSFPFVADPTGAGRYRLQASAPGRADQQAEIVLEADRTVDFSWP